MSAYLQEDNAVVIHGHRVLQLDGSSFIMSDSFLDVWSHPLLAPEQHAGNRLLQKIGIFVTFHFSFQLASRLFSSVLCDVLVRPGTSASATPCRACSLSHWKM